MSKLNLNLKIFKQIAPAVYPRIDGEYGGSIAEFKKDVVLNLLTGIIQQNSVDTTGPKPTSKMSYDNSKKWGKIQNAFIFQDGFIVELSEGELEFLKSQIKNCASFDPRSSYVVNVVDEAVCEAYKAGENTTDLANDPELLKDVPDYEEYVKNLRSQNAPVEPQA